MFRFIKIGVGIVVCWASHAMIHAQPPEVKPIDQAIADGLKNVHNRGADIHNGGDPIGALRMYQGALIGLHPLLAHRPDVQRAIEDGLKAAESRPMTERGMALSKTIADVRKRVLGQLTELHAPKPLPPTNAPPNPTPAINPGPPVNPPSSFGTPTPAPPLSLTLWDRLGGEKKMEKVVEEWLTRSLADPKVNLNRGGQFKIEGEGLATIKRRLVGYISSLTDGTVPYTGRPMKESHAGMNITAEEFTAMVSHLKPALRKEGASDADADLLVGKVESSKKDIVTK